MPYRPDAGQNCSIEACSIYMYKPTRKSRIPPTVALYKENELHILVIYFYPQQKEGKEGKWGF